MASSFTDINNPNELNTSRASTTVKTHGATATYTDNTGSATTDYAYHGGASQSYSMMETKTFNPNNSSSLTQNDSFNTTMHDSYSQVRGMKETRVFGDFNIITGSPNFFTDGIASSYIQKRSEIPAGPETADEAVGTASGAKYTSKSTPDPKSGSTVGKTGAAGTKGGKATTPPEPAVQNRGQLLPLIQQDLTKIEKNMGNGGHVKIMSCRHVYIQSGAAASTMDTAIVKKKGRQYKGPFTTKKKEEGSPDVKNKKGRPSTNIVDMEPLVAGPQVETVDTTSNMPFGNIYIRPGNEFSVSAGTGGISMISGGANKITGLGNTVISSPGVLVQGSQSVDVKGDSNVNIIGAQTTVESPESVFTGNVSIYGNVTIKGNLHVEGKFTVAQTAEVSQSLSVRGGINGFSGAIISDNIITTGGDVKTKKCTLNTHWHREQGDGKPTSDPKG